MRIAGSLPLEKVPLSVSVNTNDFRLINRLRLTWHLPSDNATDISEHYTQRMPTGCLLLLSFPRESYQDGEI